MSTQGNRKQGHSIHVKRMIESKEGLQIRIYRMKRPTGLVGALHCANRLLPDGVWLDGPAARQDETIYQGARITYVSKGLVE